MAGAPFLKRTVYLQAMVKCPDSLQVQRPNLNKPAGMLFLLRSSSPRFVIPAMESLTLFQPIESKYTEDEPQSLGSGVYTTNSVRVLRAMYSPNIYKDPRPLSNYTSGIFKRNQKSIWLSPWQADQPSQVQKFKFALEDIAGIPLNVSQLHIPKPKYQTMYLPGKHCSYIVSS